MESGFFFLRHKPYQKMENLRPFTVDAQANRQVQEQVEESGTVGRFEIHSMNSAADNDKLEKQTGRTGLV